MIPLDLFNSDDMKKRRENAFAKARKTKPSVARVSDVEAGGTRTAVYSVNQYQVQIFRDLDQQIFTECGCSAGTPPIDPDTELPSREAAICYHWASVLLYIAEQERDENRDSISG